MNSYYTDMHIHSTFSDGTYSVQEIFHYAKKKGLKSIMISDHDYCESFDEISFFSKEYNLETISAVEISTTYKGKGIHLLAYGINVFHQGLMSLLAKIRESRFYRAKKIVENLRKIYKLDIQFEDILKNKSKNIGRPHIAKVLVDKNIVSSINEAFKYYLGNQNAAYVEKYQANVTETIKLIHNGSGVASLAHVGRYYDKEMLDYLVECGLDAIEVFHPSHSLEFKEVLTNFAIKNDLLITGGSDFHGEKTLLHDLGSEYVPYKYYEILLERVKK